MPSAYPAGSATISGALTISSITAASATNIVANTPTGGAAQAVTAASATFTSGVTPTGGAAMAVTAASATFTAGVTPTAQVAQAVTAASATFTVSMNQAGNSCYSATALSATVQQVTSAAASFCGGMFLNISAAPAYIQCFAVSATGDVSLGSTAPKLILPIPVASTAANGVAFIAELQTGVTFAKGICIAATTTATGSTGPSAALVGFVEYRPT